MSDESTIRSFASRSWGSDVTDPGRVTGTPLANDFDEFSSYIRENMYVVLYIMIKIRPTPNFYFYFRGMVLHPVYLQVVDFCYNF